MFVGGRCDTTANSVGVECNLSRVSQTEVLELGHDTFNSYGVGQPARRMLLQTFSSYGVEDE
jgi:hypothetical protein